MLHDLGLRERLAACGTVPTELIYRSWSAGERITSRPVGEGYAERFGAPYHGVHRADLQHALAEACAPDALRLGHRLIDLSEPDGSYRLEFADGRRRTPISSSVPTACTPRPDR